jgi:hypothetical protein
LERTLERKRRWSLSGRRWREAARFGWYRCSGSSKVQQQAQTKVQAVVKKAEEVRVQQRGAGQSRSGSGKSRRNSRHNNNQRRRRR